MSSKKRYTLTLVIEEGNDEFWEEINERGVTGCDEVQKMIEHALGDYGCYVNSTHSNDTLVITGFERVE